MRTTADSPYLVQSFQYWRRLIFALLGFLAAALAFCWWEARLPDEDLVFTRQAESELSSELLAQKLENVGEWKDWFHNARDVRVLDAENRPLPPEKQKATTGARLEILIDPGKGASRRFQVAGMITRFEPGKLLEIRVLDDSSGKIFKLFNELSWKIELRPEGQHKILLIGTEMAHTSHWRSRLFGRVAPRVILNQLFYPNLMVLANPHTPPKAEGIF